MMPGRRTIVRHDPMMLRELEKINKKLGGILLIMSKILGEVYNEDN